MSSSVLCRCVPYEWVRNWVGLFLFGHTGKGDVVSQGEETHTENDFMRLGVGLQICLSREDVQSWTNYQRSSRDSKARLMIFRPLVVAELSLNRMLTLPDNPYAAPQLLYFVRIQPLNLKSAG